MTGYTAGRSFAAHTRFLYSKLGNQEAFGQVSRWSHLTSRKAYVVYATATISLWKS